MALDNFDMMVPVTIIGSRECRRKAMDILTFQPHRSRVMAYDVAWVTLFPNQAVVDPGCATTQTQYVAHAVADKQ